MTPIRTQSGPARTRSARVAGLLAVLLLAATAPPASAESARDVLERAMERQEKRLEGIAGYTLVQTAMGRDMTQHFEKRIVDGHPAMVPVDGPGSGQFDAADYYRALTRAADHARLDGTDRVEGNACDVVRIDDLSKVDLGADLSAPGSDFRPKSGAFLFDRKSSYLRRMTMVGEAMNEGQTAEVTLTLDLLDWRDTGGFPYPYRTVMTMAGIDSAMSPEDMEQARASLAQMKEQMASMPEEQRKMMESMMGGQLEQLEKMVGGEAMEMEVTVKSLEVERE